jgi:uncharacterized protein (DUF849 family)
MTSPVIIEAALNGVTTKEQNPNVPWTPAEIVRSALACLDAGAAILHNHIDLYAVAGERAAERYLEAWRAVWSMRPGALLYPTVNGGPVEQSFSHLTVLAHEGCRLGLIEAGSVNLGPIVYANSTADIAHQIEVCQANGLGASLAVFEPGFLRTALRLHDAGRLPQGTIAKLFFCDEGGYAGGVFGLPPTRQSFDAYVALLGDSGLPWMAALLGGDLLATDLPTWTLEAGGHLHVGLEDYADLSGKDRRPTNEELVKRAVALCQERGRSVATSHEAAALIGLAA